MCKLFLVFKFLELALTLVQDLISHAHVGNIIEAFFELMSYIDQIATLVMHNLPIATPLSLDIIC